jgi:hypothetical protein
VPQKSNDEASFLAAIGRECAAAFATWVALSVLTYQDGPDDKPLIVSMLSK